MDDDIQAPGANPEKLMSLVSAAFDGKVVVPEFQREFVWPRESVEELLTSLLNRYFIGTLLTLDTPAHDPLFPFRVIEGVRELRGTIPAPSGTVRLVLDGQQRLTSLFYAIHQPPIGLRWTSHPYKFFVRLEPALASELDDAIAGVSTGWSTGIQRFEKEVAAHQALPLPVLAKQDLFYPWLYSQGVWDDGQKVELTALHRRLADFMIPVVSLVSETGADNIVNIFERVNRTGVPLSLFDLVAARMYLQGLVKPTLHALWKEFSAEHSELADQIGSNAMLRLVALLEGMELKKATLLGLDSLGRDGFLDRWKQAAECIVQAWERLRVEYGAYGGRLIPYGTMLVPLAALLDYLKSRKLQASAFRRLDIWYWRSVFGQRYESGVNNKIVLDVADVGRWCEGGNAPAWMGDLEVHDIQLDADAPRSAIYRGVLCLSALMGARDFCTGEPIALNECEDDHVFAKGVYAGSHPVNGVLNRAFIKKECNNFKRAKPPATFFAHCLQGHGGDEELLLSTLGSHLISRDAYQSLLANDFLTFVEHRRASVSNAIAARIAWDG